MFGIDGPEFLVILAVAIMVIGPKELPRALYMTGKFIRKFKASTTNIQKSLDEMMREGELEEITREASDNTNRENGQFRTERRSEAKSATLKPEGQKTESE